uniref:Uncharacterized protein n=1 Tax=Romanomermis culicivorax TaxID=13658 RepID=A0A915JQK5_ROMCU
GFLLFYTFYTFPLKLLTHQHQNYSDHFGENSVENLVITINLAVRQANRRFNDKPESGQTLLDDNNSNAEDEIVNAALEKDIEAVDNTVSQPPGA